MIQGAMVQNEAGQELGQELGLVSHWQKELVEAFMSFCSSQVKAGRFWTKAREAVVPQV